MISVNPKLTLLFSLHIFFWSEVGKKRLQIAKIYEPLFIYVLCAAFGKKSEDNWESFSFHYVGSREIKLRTCWHDGSKCLYPVGHLILLEPEPLVYIKYLTSMGS